MTAAIHTQSDSPIYDALLEKMNNPSPIHDKLNYAVMLEENLAEYNRELSLLTPFHAYARHSLERRTIMNAPHARKSLLAIALFFVILLAAIFFTGCSSLTDKEPVSQASAVTDNEEVPEPPTEEYRYIKQFGDTITFDDGSAISASAPQPFVQSDAGYGAVDGYVNYSFDITFTNTSDEPIEPLVYTTASAAGVEADMIWDDGINRAPATAILPGQSATWTDAFSFKTGEEITLDIAVDFYDTAIFTNVPF